MLLTASLVPATGAASATPPASNCTEYSVPVALTAGGPADQTLVGELCLPDSGTPETVQLLVHGATYNRAYWDFPYQPQIYSYVKYANRAGYATFNVEIVGSGESSRPHSSQIDVFTSAHALHNVITKLRAGDIGPIAYEKVIWVGHSMGTAIGWVEASTYNDVDAFIATGATHPVSNTAATGSAPFPASLDPKFTSLNLDDGYLSTDAVSRATNFFYANTTDPQVKTEDYALRDTFTLPMLLTAVGQFSAPVATASTQGITVPVLSLIGEKDFLFCQPDASDCNNRAAMQASEAAYHSNASSFDLVVVPQTGHDLNLHHTAPFSFLTMLTWAKQHVAP
ncbi:alpha/beta fold hydrolase [Micromonospora echinofusca]|uniref:Alpha/beta fold hydrolase n=1 Tax=Micromonospora echinofusca TaxID=47858 RepID=A0ABS3VYM1_MICEH|nr:alpha/beta fold hydrolase [Micromonospora echinofusca]MBO4209641.1 alpha/beta fold hydrolase [Micromonospora echinofusca]